MRDVGYGGTGSTLREAGTRVAVRNNDTIWRTETGDEYWPPFYRFFTRVCDVRTPQVAE
jgi:hypothetical protein